MSHRQRSSFRPCLERLEARTVPTNFVVNGAGMDFAVNGQVTLLEAIQAANTNAPSGDAPAGSAGLDTIQFDPVLNGQTIANTLGAPLAVTEALTIDGPGSGLLTFSGNNVTRLFNVSAGVDVVIRGLTLTQGSGPGGAIINQGNLILADTILTACNSGTSGGAIYNFGNLTLSNCTLSGNTAIVLGGGIYNLGTLTVNNSSFIANSAQYGGGIMSQGASSLVGTTFAGNTAWSSAGGSYLSSISTVSNCTYTGNSASGGGGIENFGTLTVSNTTVSGNSANAGAGIENQGTLIVANSTIAGNSAVNDGGGIRNTSATPTVLASTIVSGNTASTGPDLSGPFTLAHTLIRRMGGFTFTESAPGTNLFGLDPSLGPLAHNGGLYLTHALLPGSPALDRGSNPFAFTIDARAGGMMRVVGAAADIGAFESHDSDVRIVPDPLERSKNVLVVVGTRRSDTIGFRTDEGDLEVNLNGEFFAFDPQVIHRLVAFGMEGSDTIRSALSIPALFDGGRGADALTGGGATDILLGGIGADILLGGGGRDILIGGNGADRATGGGGDDLLIGGRTTYDQDQSSLSLLLAVWNSTLTYAQRRDNLASGAGVPQLSAAQITDGFADKLTGDSGLEIFFSGPGDELLGKAAGEKKVGVT